MDYYWQEFKSLFKTAYKDFTDFLVNLYENTLSVLDNTFIYLPKHINFFIKRMVELIPVVWRDADYDWSSILLFMKFKINKIRLCLEKEGDRKNSKKYLKELKEAEKLLDIVSDEYYYWEECVKPVEKQYGKNILYIEEGKDKKRALRVLVRRENWTEELSKKIYKEESKAINKSYEKYEKQWHKLWEHLDKNMRNWWD